MSLAELFFGKKKASGSTAKDRLTLMLAHERADNSLPNMDMLKQELLQVVKKYVNVKDIKVKAEQNNNVDILEFEISLG
jgi:cell division topological specificity factor